MSDVARDALRRLRQRSAAARAEKKPEKRRTLMMSIGLEPEIGEAELEPGPEVEIGQAELEPEDDDVSVSVGPTEYDNEEDDPRRRRAR